MLAQNQTLKRKIRDSDAAPHIRYIEPQKSFLCFKLVKSTKVAKSPLLKMF